MSDRIDLRAYQAAFHLSGEAAAFVDADNVVLAMSPGFAELFPSSVEDLRRFSDAFASHDRARVDEFLRNARRWSEASVAGATLGEDMLHPVDLWANQYVATEGDRILLVRARSARPRLEAERLHRAAVLAARACNAATDWRSLSEGAAKVVADVLPQMTGSGWLRRDGDRWLVVGAMGALEAWRIRADDSAGSLWARFAEGGEPVLIADVGFELPAEDAFEGAQADARSLIVSPLVVAGRVDGLVVTISGAQAAFSLEDLRCVEAVAREMASAIARLEAHEALSRSHAELQRAFAENETLLARVRRLHAELEDFALWTTHDLREPLRGLATLAEVVADQSDRSPPLRDVSRALADAATRLKEHIRALHDFHENARDTARREDAEVSELVRSAMADAQHADVVLVPSESAVHARVDPLRVVRAIADVIRFAHARSGGPIRVEIVRTDDARARVDVELARVATAREAEAAFHLVGTRDSLALARRIALQHGGSLDFDASGRLSLSLPCDAAPLAAPPPSPDWALALRRD